MMQFAVDIYKYISEKNVDILIPVSMMFVSPGATDSNSVLFQGVWEVITWANFVDFYASLVLNLIRIMQTKWPTFPSHGWKIVFVFQNSLKFVPNASICTPTIGSPHYLNQWPSSVWHYKRLRALALRWRHNDYDGVSNHQPHGCLLNRLFRRRSKKTSKLRVTGLCVGNSPGPVNSPHKEPVTRKMFPFDDVIMVCLWQPGGSGFISIPVYTGWPADIQNSQ